MADTSFTYRLTASGNSGSDDAIVNLTLSTPVPPPSSLFGYPVPTAPRPTNHNWRDLVLWAGAASVPNQPPTRSWPTQSYHVENDFGANGTGTVNAAAQLINCFNSAKADNRRVIFGNNRQYRTDSKLTLSNWNSLVLEGNGSTIIAGPSVPTQNSGNSVFNIMDCRGVRVYDLKFDGNNSSRGTPENHSGHTLFIVNSHDVACVQVETNRGATDGFYIGVAGSPVTISRMPTFNAFLHCGGELNGRNAISVIVGHDLYIIGGLWRRQIYRNPASGIDFEPNNNAWDQLGVPQVRRAYVLGTTCEDNYNSGLQFAHMGHGVLQDVFVQDNLLRRNGAGRSITNFGWAPLAMCRMINGVFRHNMIRDHTQAIVGNKQRQPGIWFGAIAAGHGYPLYYFPGPYLFDDNYFRNNSAYHVGDDMMVTPVCQASSHGGLNVVVDRMTFTNNKFDLRGVRSASHATSFPTRPNSVFGNTCWRDGNSSTNPFQQNAGANTVITGTPPW